MTFLLGGSSDIKISIAKNEKNNELWHCKYIFQEWEDYKAEIFTKNAKKSILSANSLVTASSDHIRDHDYDCVIDHCLSEEMSILALRENWSVPK